MALYASQGRSPGLVTGWLDILQGEAQTPVALFLLFIHRRHLRTDQRLLNVDIEQIRELCLRQ